MDEFVEAFQAEPGPAFPIAAFDEVSVAITWAGEAVELGGSDGSGGPIAHGDDDTGYTATGFGAAYAKQESITGSTSGEAEPE